MVEPELPVPRGLLLIRPRAARPCPVCESVWLRLGHRASVTSPALWVCWSNVKHPASDGQILKKLRRLPGGPAAEAPLVRCLLRSARQRFTSAALVASLTAGLSKYRPGLGVALVDALLEEIRLGLEHPDAGVHPRTDTLRSAFGAQHCSSWASARFCHCDHERRRRVRCIFGTTAPEGGQVLVHSAISCVPRAGMYQRQVAHVRLLGEAYSFRLVDSGVIFDTLQLLLAFGHDAPDTVAALDPPTSFFRIRRAACWRLAPHTCFRPGCYSRKSPLTIGRALLRT